MKRIISALIIVLLCAAAPAPAEETPSPMETLRKPIDRVMEILRDPKYKTDPDNEAQREALWNEIRGVFDFDRIAMLALGNYRKKFSKPQLREFADIFADISGNHYLKKIQGGFSNEQVKYLEEKIDADGRYKTAEVYTEILREEVAVPVTYKMWLKNGEWKIYDVRVEGVSLVIFYRDQYQKTLLNTPPDEFLKDLKAEQAAEKDGA